MARTTSLSNNKKRQVKALSEQAAQAFTNGRLDICELIFRKIESIQQGNADVANMRGIISTQAGRLKDAEQQFVNAINAAPRRIDFHTNLGKLYLKSGLPGDALKRYQAALQLDAHSLDAQLGFGVTLTQLGNPEAAIPVFKKALKRHSRNPDLLMGLAKAYMAAKEPGKARDTVNQILERDANHIPARLELASVDVQEGHRDEAEQEVRKVLALDPNNVAAYATLAEVKKGDSENDPDIAAMIHLHGKLDPSSASRMTLAFALSQMLDKLKQYDQSFEYCREGNDLRHKHSHYNADEELAHLQNIMEAYTPATFANASDLNDPTPLFIVGMPRCGSTLTEQILASHPDVASEGEWSFFERVLSQKNTEREPLTLERLTSFNSDQWREIGQEFLERIKSDHPQAVHVTDKSLNNIRLIGAIHCAMPNAKIIHVRRHPLDTCLSIYRNNLLGAQFEFGFNLGELGYYYRMYLRLMQHWRDILPAGVMYELDYEKLVGDQEAETRSLLKFCNLPWNDQCLQFYKTKNLVQTASVSQVRQPMYTGSMAAWKRYEEHLQPLIRILGTDYGHPPAGGQPGY